MARNNFSRKTPAQQRAILDNGCLRALAGLATQFKLAGHHDFEMKVKSLDAEFRGKLKRTK